MAVGRFQVMATLQAARAFELGLPLESAESWGLNRAIFYAAAKRGFKGGPRTKSPPAAGRSGHTTGPPSRDFLLGDEKAFVQKTNGERPLFVIGGETQTQRDFERQISSRFNGKFDSAWEEALDYVRHFDRKTLLSGEEFFASVYKPKRDELASKWTELANENTNGKAATVKKHTA